MNGYEAIPYFTWLSGFVTGVGLFYIVNNRIIPELKKYLIKKKNGKYEP